MSKKIIIILITFRLSNNNGDGGCRACSLKADLQLKSVGLVWRSAAAWRSVRWTTCTAPLNRLSPCYGAIEIAVVIIFIIVISHGYYYGGAITKLYCRTTLQCHKSCKYHDSKYVSENTCAGSQFTGNYDLQNSPKLISIICSYLSHIKTYFAQHSFHYATPKLISIIYTYLHCHEWWQDGSCKRESLEPRFENHFITAKTLSRLLNGLQQR